ncbi:FERM and PDZ domain-containing protein 1 [Rhinophrynus dorsalis]
MEDPETTLFQTRKGHRIEQMVVRWLRRSRDNSSRRRNSVDGPAGGSNQYTCSLKLTLVIQKDPLLYHYGFDISRNLPLTIAAITAGSPAEGKLFPGDQILRINNDNVENISIEQAAELVRESGDSVTLTVLRNTLSPKSSFLTAEKRAKLRSNPVKVRFAEEVVVNGHTQGNSLLFMPNVLKVYLENGQTKAFKFETKTTVKDIILTLKEKLSINIIEHFALALEEQYNISKLYLLHEDELIEQVVQKRESHDYRCLFRVCFVPKDPLALMQEDPVTFEYLYLQSCSDVLQERFAVEMKCSVALRLAALHIQERIHTCGQPQKISFKYIEKDWGIDNFLSPTLLRNMRGKDIKKAISFHMKRNQCILEPRQKPISAAQVRLNYLKILGDLKTYGGKIFNATLMLQDRESYVTLLVGAKYGISQIINNKLNIMTCLAEFSNISRIELTPESEKISMVKVYLQDIKPLSLLLESNNAKDIACLISGYCKLFVESTSNIFLYPGNSQVHRVSAEEGYESRACSDSEESSDIDSSLEFSSDRHFLKYHSIKPLPEEEEDEEQEEGSIHDFKQNGEKKDCDVGEKGCYDGDNNDTDSISEASDSANTESHGYKISWSSDSIDALEEDDLETCSSSRPEFFQFFNPTLKGHGVFNNNEELKIKEDGVVESDPLLCFLQLSSSTSDSVMDMKESSRSPRDTSCTEDSEHNGYYIGCHLVENNVMEYYSLCSNVSPASSVERNISNSLEINSVTDLVTESEIKDQLCSLSLNDEVDTLILDPPPGFGDSSSEEEFFDAKDRFTPTLNSPGRKSVSNTEEIKCLFPDKISIQDSHVLMKNSTENHQKTDYSKKSEKALRKRRSFLQTDYTSQVTFPLSQSNSLETTDHVCCYEKESHLPDGCLSPTVSCLKDTEGEPALLETKPLIQHKSTVRIASKTHSPNLMEMEPDTMETKSVTDSVVSSISAIRLRSDHGAEDRGQNGKHCPLSSNNSVSISDWNILEQSGCASPSQISLQLENISINGLSDLSLTALDFNDSNSIHLLKNENVIEDFEPVITKFKNIFENGVQCEQLNEHTDSISCTDYTDRKSLYVAKSEDGFTSSIPTSVQSESAECEDNVGSLQSSSIDYHTELFDICNTSNYFLSGFKGITNICTQFTNQSLKEEASSLVSTVYNVCPGDVEEHLLHNTDSKEGCTGLPNIVRCRTDRKDMMSPSPHSSYSTLDTLELCYDENKEERECGDISEEICDAHSLNTKNHPSASQSSRQDPSHKNFSTNDDACGVENEWYALCDPEQKKPKISKAENARNCSCQLPYTSCFRGVDTEPEDENVDFGGIVSSLPKTIPPLSGNVLFLERQHFGLMNSTSDSTVFLEHREALNRLQRSIHDAPTGFVKLQDCVLDLQNILEEYKNKGEMHPPYKCAVHFAEQKASLCSVSRKLMSISQKVLKSNQSTEEMYHAVEETFFSLLQMTDVCLQLSKCDQCSRRQMDVQANLGDLICTYHQFVQAAKKASESESRGLHFKLLSRQCTALTAAVFCLTQQFRTLMSS